VDSFWFLTATVLNTENVYNYSWPGNSFDSVVHNLISESDQYDWENDFFIVGIPPLSRLTIVSKDSTLSYHRRLFDSTATEIDQQLILCHHGLENRQFIHDPLAVRFENPTWTQTQTLRTVYLLNAWLDSKKANYLIVNLSKDFLTEHSATGSFLLNACLNHPRNMLRGDTYYNVNLNRNKPADFDQYGWAGHHGPAGNHCFFEQAVMPRLVKNNLL
jgi:hypothetical protein